jgi:FkbM family methyltransferase
LEEAGLGDWLSPDNRSYVERAVALATDPAKRQAERHRLAEARKKGLQLFDTAAYAARLMPALDGALSEWNQRMATLRTAPLESSVAAASIELAERLPSFADTDLVLSIVLPYLRAGSSRRMLDVGACIGGMTRPFLEEGWQSVMFEPDVRCHEQLSNLVQTYPGQVRLEKAAVTVQDGGTVQFHFAGIPGLSGLSTSPFAPDVATIDVPSIALSAYIARNGLNDVDFIKVDTEGNDFVVIESIDFGELRPRLIIVKFGEQFAGQGRDSIADFLTRMHARDYRACVVCLRALGSFERHEWQTRLLAITIDSLPASNCDGKLFGNILLFREDDHEFLPSLCDWLEQMRLGSARDRHQQEHSISAAR